MWRKWKQYKQEKEAKETRECRKNMLDVLSGACRAMKKEKWRYKKICTNSYKDKESNEYAHARDAYISAAHKIDQCVHIEAAVRFALMSDELDMRRMWAGFLAGKEVIVDHWRTTSHVRVRLEAVMAAVMEVADSKSATLLRAFFEVWLTDSKDDARISPVEFDQMIAEEAAQVIVVKKKI